MVSQKVRSQELQYFFRLTRFTSCIFPPENPLRPIKHFFYLVLLFCLSLLFLGCQSSLLKNVQMNEFNEQLYIDAKLNFAIKHPLNWERVIHPVASPKYKADKVSWKIDNPHKENGIIGKMLIQSRPRNKNTSLPDLLSNFLADRPEVKSGQAEQFDHPAGTALKFLGHNVDRGLLTIALQGQQHDFIISLEYPSNRFDKLLPVFQDVVDSFTEVIRPGSYPEPALK